MNLTTTNFIETLEINKKKFKIISLKKIQDKFKFDLSTLPYTYRILLENLIRKKDKIKIKSEDIKNVIDQKVGREILFSPSRVLMQDYTGVPAVADLAAMRDKVKSKGDNPEIINPVVPVSLVIDHSINVDSYSKQDSLIYNVKKEYERNSERYNVGQVSSIEFRRAQLNLLNAELSRNSAKYRAKISEAYFLKISGDLISRFK